VKSCGNIRSAYDEMNASGCVVFLSMLIVNGGHRRVMQIEATRFYPVGAAFIRETWMPVWVSPRSQFGRSAASLKLAVKMNNRIKIAFLTMISLQAVHSIEEYIFKFYEVFPPMQFIYRDAPDLAKSGFVTFNLLLFLFGIICFFYWVQPARKGARVVIWVWIAIQLATIASHAIWVMSVGDYHPGLATVPLFVPIVVFMMYLLHHAPTKPPPNKSLDARRKQ